MPPASQQSAGGNDASNAGEMASLRGEVSRLQRDVRILVAILITIGFCMFFDVRVFDNSRGGSGSASTSTALRHHHEATAAPSSGASAATPAAPVAPVPAKQQQQQNQPVAAPPQYDDAPKPTPNPPPAPAPPGDASALGSDWVPALEPSTCPQPNGPNKNFAFWKSLPQYPKFLAHHNKMVDHLAALNRGESAEEHGKALFKLYDEILHELVRPNPAVEFGENYMAGKSRIIPFAHGIHAVDAWRANGPALFSRRSLSGCYECSYSGQRMQATIMLHIEAGNTRAAKDPSFKPRFFIDLGSRDYEDRFDRSDGMDRVLGKKVQYYASSTRFMEAHYPGFDKMAVLAIDADPKYGAAYKRLGAKRPNVPTTFWGAAGWVHDDGLGFRRSDMLSEAVDGCWPQRDGAACRCATTVNMTRVFLGLPPGDVTLKIDVEYAEWVLLEYWLRAGVFNRVKEVFFECHSLYRLGGETIFPKPPALNGFLRDLYERLVGVLDCYLAHDLMRAEGVVTHNWP